MKNKVLFNLSSGHFVLDLYASILIPLYPFIAQRLNINLAQISLVIAIGHSISSVLQPLWGYVSDKIQKRFFMFWGLIFASIFFPFGYFTPNMVILTFCLILGMIGNAFYHPQVTSIIKDFYKENIELSKAIGVFLGLGTIGYALGPYLSTYIIKNFGSNNFMYIGAIGIIVAFLLLFFVPKVKKKEVKSDCNFFYAIKDIFKNKPCLILIIITIIKSALIMSYGTYIPFLLKQNNFTFTQTGFIMTLFFVMGGLSMIFATKFEKIVKLKGMIMLSYLPLLPLTIFALISLNYSKILSVLFLLFIGFFVLLSAGSILAGAQRLIPNNTGTISGIIQGFTLAIGSLLLIPLGALAQNIGIPSVLILIASTAGLGAIYCFKVKLFL